MKQELIRELNIPSDVVIVEVKGYGADEQTVELDLTSDRVPDEAFRLMQRGVNFVRDAIQSGNDQATCNYSFNAYGKDYNKHISYRVCKRK